MNINKLLKKIADDNGTSVKKVRQEIQKALDEGYNSDDKTVQAYWKQIPSKNQKPTLEEVLKYLINSI